MLPIKVFQMDYQDFASLVWNHFEQIEQYQETHQLKFDFVVGKLRNGMVPASIVATYLNLPLAALSAPRKVNHEGYEVFFPQEIAQMLSSGKKLNVLFVDSICGTGTTLNEVKELFNKQHAANINLHSYCTLVDVRATTKPDILGLVHSKFFQPPWEWRAFTPQTHLDRLEISDIKASQEDQYYIGFASDKCKLSIEIALGQKLTADWINIFNLVDMHRKIQTTSGISALDIPVEPVTMEEARAKFALLIEEKIKFIQSNGFTHFIEDDWVQALLISQKCPVCHIVYFDGKELHKLYAKQLDKQQLLKLNS